jgi:hypothetical protein
MIEDSYWIIGFRYLQRNFITGTSDRSYGKVENFVVNSISISIPRSSMQGNHNSFRMYVPHLWLLVLDACKEMTSIEYPLSLHDSIMNHDFSNRHHDLNIVLGN